MLTLDERKRQIAEKMTIGQQMLENSKYGEFIIQTNKVQMYLTLLVFQRASFPSKKLLRYLERLQLGNLIEYFGINAPSSEANLLNGLRNYKDSRDALAHQMYTDKKLTARECEISLKLGQFILEYIRSVFDVQYLKVKLPKKS